MIRGSIYWVNLEPSSPPELGKVRPGIVISNSEQNLLLSTVVIIPVSSQKPEIWPLRVEVTWRKRSSFAVIPGLRQVNKTRLHDRIESLSDESLARIDEAVSMYLSD